MFDPPVFNANITEAELYENIINKIEKIKTKIIKIKNYSNEHTEKSLKFLEIFNEFSNELGKLKILVDDTYDEFILGIDPTELSNNDQNERKKIIVEKKIQNIFLPYMLYFQILLNNSNE